MRARRGDRELTRSRIGLVSDRGGCMIENTLVATLRCIVIRSVPATLGPPLRVEAINECDRRIGPGFHTDVVLAKQHLGSLDKVTRIVRLGVSVAASRDVRNPPKVADAASELLQDVFGKARRWRIRSALDVVGDAAQRTREVEMRLVRPLRWIRRSWVGAMALVGPEKIRVYVRSLCRDHEPLQRSAWALALYALYSGLRRTGGFSDGLGASGADRGSHRAGTRWRTTKVWGRTGRRGALSGPIARPTKPRFVQISCP